MESFIGQVVELFYEKVAGDVLIGYHFRKTNFSKHIPHITEFWCKQLLDHRLLPSPSASLGSVGPAGPAGKLLQIHAPLNLKRGEVGRFSLLFCQTLASCISDLEEADKSRRELLGRWEKKVLHFEKKFLNSSLLFPGQ